MSNSEQQKVNTFGHKHGSMWDLLYFGQLSDRFRKASPQKQDEMANAAELEMNELVERIAKSDITQVLKDQQKRLFS
jgi:hypothetical protein